MISSLLFAIGAVPAAIASAIPSAGHPKLAASSAMHPRSTGMRYSDRFAESGLDYEAWVARMVAEGKLVRPEVNTTVRFQTAAIDFGLKNMACGVLASSDNSFDRAIIEGCQFGRLYFGSAVEVFRYMAINDFCPDADNDNCVLLMDMGFDVGGAYIKGGVNQYCERIMREITSTCPGAVGGTAEITVTRDDGRTFSGSVGIQNYEDDPGATCPANPITATQVCHVTTAG